MENKPEYNLDKFFDEDLDNDNLEIDKFDDEDFDIEDFEIDANDRFHNLFEDVQKNHNANTNIRYFMNLLLWHQFDIKEMKSKPYLIFPKIKGAYTKFEPIEVIIREPVYDSRKVNENTSFVALKGLSNDGHNYIEDVINRGCKLIFCEFIPENLLPKLKEYVDNEVSFILVKNTRILLSYLAFHYYDNHKKDIEYIGVTGTNGKTTITYLIKEILTKYPNKNVGLIGTTGIFYNGKKIEATHTTPESLELAQIINQMGNEGVNVIVMEVSSHALVQYRVANIPFSKAVFTNLTHDHLDYHKTMDNYARAKKLLFDRLDDKAFAIINGNDKYADFMVKDTRATIDYIYFEDEGRKKANKHYHKKIETFFVDNIKVSLDGVSFDFQEKPKFRNDVSIKKKYNITSNLIGKFNVYNLALASMVATETGYILNNEEDVDLVKIISEVKGAKGRMDSYKINTGATAIIDYAHTPDSLEKALKTLDEVRKNNKESRLMVIFGCGGDRDKTKRPIMGKIATEIADIVILTDDNPRTEVNTEITNEIASGIDEKLIGKIKIINDRKEAIKFALENSKANDLILIAGKGHGDYQIIGKEKIHLSDEEEVLRYVK